MNKARIAVLAILTLSVINLCFMIFSNLVGMRAFPDYSPMVMTLFNVFLITLGLLSIWQLFTGIDGHAMRGKILLLLAVEFFAVYVADIANIFPRSTEPMGQTPFAVEIFGAVLAVLLFVSASWYIKAVNVPESV
ncbi:hypothetical protein ACPESL_11035 [Psychrobacter pocilloporae]|uniref:DUF8051 domain-containing protein n=1 Tax=Psychrobacter piscatorii TaxID=554343 RepID=A0A0T6DNC8_9GAMM|nr:hypothetical protein [Psychrobacter piscatorii]KRU21492.1 hypothetical protein AS194_11985 [Psychrobacter piscatorii]